MGIKTRETAKSRIKTAERVSHLPYTRTRDRTIQGDGSENGTVSGYASEQITETSQRVIKEGGRQLYRGEKRSIQDTKKNLSKAKEKMDDFRKNKEGQKAAIERKEQGGCHEPFDSSQPFARPMVEGGRSSTVRQKADNRVIKVHGGKEKQAIQGAAKNTVRAVPKGVKTAQAASKITIRTSGQAARGPWTAIEASLQAAKKKVWMTSAKQRGTWAAVKRTVQITTKNVRLILSGAKALTTALIAGGGIALSGILVVSLVGLLISSVFGIFFSGEDSGSGMTMREAVQEINNGYEVRLNDVIDGTAHDTLEISGGRAVWNDVLAVYAVKIATDPEAPQEVATMDAGKKELLKEIFWEMHEINSRIENQVAESDDSNGNICLYITVSNKDAWEMADLYGFSEEQREQLSELLSEEHAAVWSQVLYGIGGSDNQIVSVALEQVGNGGDIYWSWYGFDYRVEWCACFVSWCADQCGYIDSGVIPKFASCQAGSEWFKDRGQWQDRNFEPSAGQLIFFDWGGDGHTEHVGIVERVENGTVYTVEGNSGDLCRQRGYPIGSGDIYGYGIPDY